MTLATSGVSSPNIQTQQKSPYVTAAASVAARFGSELLGAHPAGVI